MTIAVPGEFAPFQTTLVDISPRVELHFGLKSCNDKKLDKIIRMYKKENVKSDHFYEFVKNMIDQCGCDEYTEIRWIGYKRSKTTHSQKSKL